MIFSRRFLPLTLCLSVLALSACSTTGSGTATTAPPSATDSDRIDMTKAGERIDGAFRQALAAAERSGNPQDVIAVMEPYYGRHKDNPVLAARYARALREDNQLNAARNVLAPFTKGEKANAEALTEMAMTQLSLGNYKDAELAARSAIKLDDKAGRAHLALGTSLDAQGNYKEAEESFRTGLRVWRGDAAPILNNLALNLASQGRTEQALELLDRARAEYPNRTELERNYRIIATLHDRDYHPRNDKKRAEQKKEDVKAQPQEAAPEKAAKPEEKKTEAVKEAPKAKAMEKAKETATKKANDKPANKRTDETRAGNKRYND